MKKLVLLILVLCLGGYFAWTSQPVQKFVESVPPDISVSDESSLAIGAQPAPLKFTITDNLSGIENVTVRLLQSGKELFRVEKALPQAVRDNSFSIPFDNALAKLSDGEAEIEISATDASLRENQAIKKLKIPVDRKRPQLTVYSLQHFGRQGGSQFIVFEAKDSSLARLGIQSGDTFFPAVPAHDITDLFDASSNMYVSLFAIPLGYDPSKERIELFAEDVAGNKATQNINFQIRKYTQPQSSPNLSRSFLSRKIPPLIESYNQDAQKNLQSQDLSEEQLTEAFRVINEDYRKICDAKLIQVTSSTHPEVFWKQTFIRPISASTSSNFGEKRTYMFDGKEISKSDHLGFDLASVRQDKVLSVNDGIVQFSGPLGIYGNIVVIDHGLGLSTLYAHLSSMSVSVGDKVAQGQEIGRTGETGLAGGDHLHFEFRLGGKSVWAVEWWDSHWIEDQFWGKLKAVAEALAPQEKEESTPQEK